MKKLFLSCILAFSLLFPSYSAIATKKNVEPEVQQVEVKKDGMYDDHNAYVDESKYSLKEIIESVEWVQHELVYSVRYKDADGNEHSFEKKEGYFGSGVVVEKRDNKAYILTNHHIIEEANPPSYYGLEEGCEIIEIKKISERDYISKHLNGFKLQLDAKVVSSDESLDTALLEVEDSGYLKKFPYKIGNSNDIERGDFIWIIGNPLGIEDYVLKGNIGKEINYDFNRERFMIGASIQPGYSGGAVVAIRDGEYELIGIISANLIRDSWDLSSDFLSHYGIGIKINPMMDLVNDYFKSLEEPANK